MHPYERWTLSRYLANALKSSRFARPPRADCDIVTWIESHSRLLGLPHLAPRSHASSSRTTGEAPPHSAGWKAWRVAAIGLDSEPAPNPSPLQKRLDWLARACSLNHAQIFVLGLVARAAHTPQVCTLIEAVNDRFGIRFEGVDGSDLHPFLETSSERDELSTAGRLSQMGLIEAHEALRLSIVVRRLLSLPRFEARRVSDLLLGEPACASLAWSDFEHLGDLRDLAARIVAAAGNLRVGRRAAA
jgi:transitional endoplasmic reticulum ATPase